MTKAYNSDDIDLFHAITRFALPPCFSEVHIRHFDAIDSTNTYLSEIRLKDALVSWESSGSDLYVVSADHQTCGRGKGDRQWYSSSSHKSLALSFLFPFPCSLTSRSALVTQLLALSAMEGINHLMGSDAIRLKWPNDLTLGNRKIGGILAEMHSLEGKGFNAIVIGIGLNLDIPDKVLESGIPMGRLWPPGAIKQLTGMDLDRKYVRDMIVLEFIRRLSDLILNEGIPSHETMAALSRSQLLVGEEIQFREGSAIHRGIHRGLDDRGGLILELSEEKGKSAVFFSGEIII